MYDIITLGSSTMDVFVETETKHLKIKTKNDNQEYIAFPFGSKILINEMHHHTGGGGTNTSTTFAKSGLKTAFIGSVGDDHNGEIIKKELKKNKVKFLGKQHGKNGYSVIIDSDGDRTALTYKGCNNDVKILDKEMKKLKARYYYMTSMTGKSFEFSKKIVKFAREINAKVCFNPSSYLVKKGFTKLNSILKNTYCLILNDKEAESLTNIKGIEKNLDVLQYKIIMDGIVVITAGEKGAYAIYNHKKYQVPISKIKVKETTGAGDAFGSGFFAGIIKGKSIKFSLKMGINNAEHVIQHIGAKNGLLGRGLITLANEDKRKIREF